MADVNIDPESKDPQQLFSQGTKAFILKDFKTACDALGRATEILVAQLKDDLHDSLGDTYLLYGRSLLGLYRQDSNPIGNLPKRLEASGIEDEEEEGDNDENESKDETEENNDNEEKDETQQSNGAGDNDQAKKEDDGEEEANGDKTSENEDKNDEEDSEDCLKVDEPEKSGADESFLQIEPAEPEEDEDPTDLQLAWEVLELAKKIFEKRGDEGKKSLAETLTNLGEISLESENYLAAISDFSRARDIEVEIYPNDSRTLAQTFYSLGVAFASNSSYKEGICNLKTAIEYLERRIRNLEGTKDKLDEVEELKELIPEVYEKIRDLKAVTDETVKKLDELTKQPELANKILDGASCSSSKQASDISHLVKRKRKAEENDEESNPPKKCPQ